MRHKLTLLVMPFAGLIAFLVLQNQTVFSQARQSRAERFRHNGAVNDEDRSAVDDLKSDATEAPTGFDNLTNGFIQQGPPYETLNAENVVARRSFNDNRFIFEEFETIEDGLGPTYNAQSCRECHQNVVTGGASQVAELRSGRLENGQFFESLGGTRSRDSSSRSFVASTSLADGEAWLEGIFFRQGAGPAHLSQRTHPGALRRHGRTLCSQPG